MRPYLPLCILWMACTEGSKAPAPADTDTDTDALCIDCDGDGVTTAEGDCDDNNPARFPGNEEICNNVDDDCDALIDNSATDIITWYQDNDRDGFGTEADILVTCLQPDGYTTSPDDCDDDDRDVHPGAVETCNGKDDDCDDGIDIDAVDGETFYFDGDRDGFGVTAEAVITCEGSDDYVAADGDCDDANASTYPGAPDILCDGSDNDCDGTTFEAGQVSLDGNVVADLPTALAGSVDASTTITLCEGAYVIPEQTLSVGLTLEGAGSAITHVTSDGTGALLHVTAGAEPLITGMTLADGIGHLDSDTRRGGALFIDDGHADLVDVAVRDNTADEGGGIWVSASARLTGEFLDVHDNQATGDATAGGIGTGTGALITLSDSDVHHNAARSCGGLLLDTNATLEGDDASFIRFNTANLRGGGVCFRAGATARRVIVSHNESRTGAGAQVEESGGDVVIIDVQFTDNQATNLGGGLAAFDTVSLDTCTFLNNSAGVDGGAIHVSDTEVVVTDGIVHNNLSDGPNAIGGGARVDGGSLTSTQTDWGEAASDNTPADIGLAGSGTSVAYDGTSDFVCTDDDSTSACVP